MDETEHLKYSHARVKILRSFCFDIFARFLIEKLINRKWSEMNNYNDFILIQWKLLMHSRLSNICVYIYIYINFENYRYYWLLKRFFTWKLIIELQENHLNYKSTYLTNFIEIEMKFRWNHEDLKFFQYGVFPLDVTNMICRSTTHTHILQDLFDK